jgi:DNA invertase Pin-like site-specific DNA recombinase
MSATVWGQIQQAQSSQSRRQQDNARAAAAARGNIRGRTAPVSKGDQSGSPQGLRAALEAAADEVGFEG